MADKKKTAENLDAQEPQDLEAMADQILAAAGDIPETEPFTLIELPPESGGKKKSKKSAKSKGKQPERDPDIGDKSPEEVLNALLEKGKKAGQLTNKELEVLEKLNLDAEATDKFYGLTP